MTQNQNKAREIRENERHNQKTEEIDAQYKSDMVDETKRANRQREANDRRGQNFKLAGDLAKAAVGAGKNDPSWYNLDKQLVEDVANLSFEEALGYLSPAGYYSQGTLNKRLGVPGVQAIHFAPALGQTNLYDLGISQLAADTWYANIRKKNSGATNYDAPDIFMYLYALDSVFMLLGHCERAYSVALTAKSRNRYYPRGLLSAMGFDPDELINNITDFRGKLNSLIVLAQSLSVPDFIPLYKRHMWMVMNIFKDSDIHKSTEYIFVPELVYIWNTETSSLQAGLTPAACATNMLSLGQENNNIYGGNYNASSYTDWLALITNLLDALISDQDVGTIAGDIRKAAQAGNFKLLTISTIPDNFHIESVYSLEVLSQINNCVLAGPIEVTFATGSTEMDIGDLDSWDITQGNFGAINQDAMHTVGYFTHVNLSGNTNMSAAQLPSGGVGLVNMYKDSPTPDDNMVATRLMCAYTPRAVTLDTGLVGTAFLNQIEVNGTEVALYSVTVYTESIVNTATQFYYYVAYDGMDWDTFITQNRTINIAQDFYVLQDSCDWGPCPRICKIYGTTKANPSIIVDHTGRDLCNYVYITDTILSNLHRVAIISEFGIPVISS